MQKSLPSPACRPHLSCSSLRGVRAPPPVSRVNLNARWHRGQLQVCWGTSITTSDFKTGLTLEMGGAPWRVVEFLHVKPGKGAAFVRTKLKNCLQGNVVDKTFRAGESLTSADIQKRESQFTYVDGDYYVFMDLETYEETRVLKDETWAKYVKEASNVYLLVWNDTVISVDIPPTVILEVVETEPPAKSNTSSGGSVKPAVLETGATIQVPQFIKQGESVKVDTRTDSYLSRA